MASKLLATHPDVFWTRVNVGKADVCWEWQMSTQAAGYGQTWDGSNVVLAHRVAYELAVGPIPPGLTVDHLCFNRRCVNPAHLEVVTTAENIRRAGARKTHCPHGHEYTAENTYVGPSGGRRCRACGVARTSVKKAEKRRAEKAAVDRRCKNCGEPLPLEMRMGAKWCSAECRGRWRWANERH